MDRTRSGLSQEGQAAVSLGVIQLARTGHVELHSPNGLHAAKDIGNAISKMWTATRLIRGRGLRDAFASVIIHPTCDFPFSSCQLS